MKKSESGWLGCHIYSFVCDFIRNKNRFVVLKRRSWLVYYIKWLLMWFWKIKILCPRKYKKCYLCEFFNLVCPNTCEKLCNVLTSFRDSCRNSSRHSFGDFRIRRLPHNILQRFLELFENHSFICDFPPKLSRYYHRC